MTDGPPLIDRVAWIAGLDADPVARNRLITQCYHDLSNALFVRFGGESLNWCSYATWASLTAGRFIREEEIPAAFRKLVAGHEPIRVTLARAAAPMPLSHDGLLDLVRQIVREVAESVGTGNLAVFAELGPFFVALIRAIDRGGADAVRDMRGTQNLLDVALANYADALTSDDAHEQAQLMLHANALIGLHEQERLQPFIAGAIDAPIRDSLMGALHELVEPLEGRVRRDAARVISRLFHPVAAEAQELWQEFSTRNLMTLSLPDGTLLLGSDLPAVYPPPLARIDYPPLVELLARYGADSPESGAVDWTVLGDRMRYIVDLFRARQLDRRLLAEPLAERERTEILARAGASL